MTSVDVVIPCYRYAHYLEACVASALTQRGVDVRVLIIDDCSPDNTPEVATRIAARDSRVTYVRNERNLGLIKTANRGVIDWAKAEATVLLSADDYLTPDSLARAMAIMSRHHDVHLVFGQARIVTDDTRPVSAHEGMTPTYQIIEGSRYIRRSCEIGTPAPSPAAIVRTSEQQRLGGYVEGLPHTSDMEMWMRFATQGPVGIVREVQAGYRWHGGNMTIAYTALLVNDRRHRIATCQHVYDTWSGSAIDGFAGWIGDMKQAYGREAMYSAGRAIEAGDSESYRACLAFVEDFAPELMRSTQALALKVRRMMGPAAARSLRGAFYRLRGRRDSPAEWFQHDTEMGWWPAEDKAQLEVGS